jgi:acyl carrier protein
MVLATEDRTELRSKILAAFDEALEARQQQLTCELSDNAILLETGLDSLGFAILIVRLEEELGYDPFVIMTEPVYPRTLKEFIDVYAKFYKNNHD